MATKNEDITAIVNACDSVKEKVKGPAPKTTKADARETADKYLIKEAKFFEVAQKKPTNWICASLHGDWVQKNFFCALERK